MPDEDVNAVREVDHLIRRLVLRHFAEDGRAPEEIIALPKADGALIEQIKLTERESEVLARLVIPESNKQIAHALNLSPHTIDTHIRNIYAKLHVRSRGAAIAVAVRSGIV